MDKEQLRGCLMQLCEGGGGVAGLLGEGTSSARTE